MLKSVHKVLLLLLTVGMMVLIFVFSAEPAVESDRTSGFLVDLVLYTACPNYDTLSPDAQLAVYNTLQHLVRKAAHFTEFALLGFFLRLCLESWFPKARLSLWAWLGGTLYAVTDEIHQLSVDARSGQFQDVLLDSCGVLAGVIVGWVILTLLRRRRESRLPLRGNRCERQPSGLSAKRK